MYRKLPNRIKSIIVVDEVVALSAIENNAPVQQIQSAIQIAEQRLKPELCSSFFNDFKDLKCKVVTSVNKTYLESLFPVGTVFDIGDVVNAIEFIDNDYYLEFWYDHLWKLLSEMVIYSASPTNYSRFTSQGEIDLKPKVFGTDAQGGSSVDLATMTWKLDKLLMDRISPLIKGANEYLFDNRSSFPKVDCKDWISLSDGAKLGRKTAWITNIYKDTSTGECNQCKDRL